MFGDDEKRMSFTEHLGELRTRMIRSCVVLGIAVIGCYIISDQIFTLLAHPLRPLSQHGILSVESDPASTEAETENQSSPDNTGKKESEIRWTVLNPLEYIIVKFKIAGYGGAAFAFPFILWQICAFIFPGLHPNERRVVQILIAGCSSLAFVGVIVAYFGVFPLVLPYLLDWIPQWVEVQLRITETLSVIIKGLAGFGIAFQFPMVVLILVHVGLLTPQTLKSYRKIAIVAMTFLSALLTPPDPFSMLVMLFPLVILYESSICASYLVMRRKQTKALAVTEKED